MADHGDAPLAGYRWQYRVVLMFADSENVDLLRRQELMFKPVQSALAERDLVLITARDDDVIVIDGKSSLLRAVSLRETYAVRPDGFTLLLIGKDGGVKLRSDKPVAAKELFALIDSMPMRQQEMRR